jgi:hypothetical protein
MSINQIIETRENVPNKKLKKFNLSVFLSEMKNIFKNNKNKQILE